MTFDLSFGTAPPDVDYYDGVPPVGELLTVVNGRVPDDFRTADAVAPSLSFLDGATFVLDVPDTIPAVWGAGDDVVWAAGESLMIAAPGGVGKTTVAGQIVRGRLGLSSQLLGLPIHAGEHRTLYLAMDRPAQIARSLARQFGEHDAEVLADRLRVHRGPPPVDLARHTDCLLRMCELADADTVVVDSLKDAAIGLSDDEVGAGYNRARQRVAAAGVQIVELHHQRKSQNGSVPAKLDDVYGSVWLTAGAGSVILLWGEAGDPVVAWRHLKQPMAEVGPFQVQHDPHRGITTIYHSVDLLALAARREGVTALQAAEALGESKKPSNAAREKARRKLDALVESGHLTRTDFGTRGGTVYRDVARLEMAR